MLLLPHPGVSSEGSALVWGRKALSSSTGCRKEVFGAPLSCRGVLRTRVASRVLDNIPDFLSITVVGLSSCPEELVRWDCAVSYLGFSTCDFWLLHSYKHNKRGSNTKNIDKSVCKELEKNQREQQFYFLKICFNCPVCQDFHAQD